MLAQRYNTFQANWKHEGPSRVSFASIRTGNSMKVYLGQAKFWSLDWPPPWAPTATNINPLSSCNSSMEQLPSPSEAVKVTASNDAWLAQNLSCKHMSSLLLNPLAIVPGLPPAIRHTEIRDPDTMPHFVSWHTNGIVSFFVAGRIASPTTKLLTSTL